MGIEAAFGLPYAGPACGSEVANMAFAGILTRF